PDTTGGVGVRNRLKIPRIRRTHAAPYPERGEWSARNTQLTPKEATIHPHVAQTRSGPNSRRGSDSRASTMLVMRPNDGELHSAKAPMNTKNQPGPQRFSTDQNTSASSVAELSDNPASSRSAGKLRSASEPTIIGEMNAATPPAQNANTMNSPSP